MFYQQLEYYKSCWEGSPGTPGQAFVITPDIDEISQEFFHSINLTHIKGTLKTLIEWIDSEVKPSTTPSEVAAIKHPELIFIDLANKKTEQDLSKIHKVSGLNKLKSEKHSGKTREFYLGFKPSWDDIFDDVPAELSFYRTFQKSLENDNKLNILIGPAGSGKSTALMKAAAYLSSTGNSVYYLKEPISSLASIISELDKANTGNYYFFIDKITTVIDGLISSLEKNSHTKAIFVCGERVNVWKQRAESVLSRFSPSVTRVSSLDERDAKLILEKLEAYGPWTRIAKLSPSQRIEELIDRSKKQLLIGLLELTTGYGFHKIIEDDFKKLDSNDTRTFVVIIGLATAHNISITKDMCISALKNAEISRHINDLLLATHGIVTQSDNLLRARHPVYVDKLFNGLVELSLKDKAIRALLMTMTRNKKPISKNMSRTEVMLFKYTINYNHLHNFFHGKKEYVLRIFEDFEKHFELDGLFYLQYGLSLRSFGMNSEALNKLQTAIASWTMKQTEHAYAHQLLICALEQQSSEIAYRNLEEAKPILMRLDSQHHEEDTDYPLVTLGEYHVKIEKKFGTIDNAKRIASHYLNELKNRQIRGRNNYRIEEAKREILKTITKPQKNKKIRTSQQPPVTRSS